VAATVATQLKFGRPDIGLVLTGVLGAAVSVTVLNIPPGVTHVLVGLAAGLAVPHFAVLIDTRYRLDDPPAGIAIFGIGGAVGMLAGGLLYPGDAVTRLKLVAVASLGIVVTAAWAAVVGWVLFAILKRFTRLRVREADEFDGLDLAEHDVAAYPDFQQNTIRSFHMREA
jgi:Amt family ammonium transporter